MRTTKTETRDYRKKTMFIGADGKQKFVFGTLEADAEIARYVLAQPEASADFRQRMGMWSHAQARAILAKYRRSLRRKQSV